jgi:hypothetical protein
VPPEKRSDWWKQQALAHCAQIMKWPIEEKDAAEAALIAEWRRCSVTSRWPRPGDLFDTREEEEMPF